MLFRSIKLNVQDRQWDTFGLRSRVQLATLGFRQCGVIGGFEQGHLIMFLFFRESSSLPTCCHFLSPSVFRISNNNSYCLYHTLQLTKHFQIPCNPSLQCSQALPLFPRGGIRPGRVRWLVLSHRGGTGTRSNGDLMNPPPPPHTHTHTHTPFSQPAV